jgi:hypothetical protein
MVTSLSLRLMLDIAEDGSIKAYFKQETLSTGSLLVPVS